MRRPHTTAALLAGLLALGGLAGCQNDDEKQAEKLAEDTLGVEDSGETDVGTREQKVIVEKAVTVRDAETGQVLKKTVSETPVVVETQIKKNVDVKVGDTRAETTGPSAPGTAPSAPAAGPR